VTTEKRQEQTFITGRTRTLHHSLHSKRGRETEDNIVSSKCNSRDQLGPQMILEERRSKRGPPRIQNGSYRLKLTDKMGRGGGATMMLREPSLRTP
jgi:hypothetical protein